MKLNQNEAEYFAEALTGRNDIFELFENTGQYGDAHSLFDDLKRRIEFCLKYLNIDLNTLIENIKKYGKDKLEKKEFDAINEVFYQNETEPIRMMIFYGIAEPFILRSMVKQELLRLAFKISHIRDIFIAGIGCGEIIENINRMPFIKRINSISIKGVDISSQNIEFCKYRNKNSKLKLSFEVFDLDFYEFNNKYDLAEMSEIIEHVRYPSKLIKKMADNSRIILVTIPIMLESPDHLHLFSLDNIKKMIEEADLDIIHETIRSGFYIKQSFYFALLRNRNAILCSDR